MPVLTLVRHGETKLNRANIVQSRTPGELTEKGIRMVSNLNMTKVIKKAKAETLGQHIQNEKFTKVYSSDLKRCHDTTLNILKHSIHSQPEPELREILRERDYGDLEFKSGTFVLELMKKHSMPGPMVPVPGGESFEDARKRAGRFFQEICELVDTSEDPDLKILVVSHGAWIFAFLDHLATNSDQFELRNYDHEKASSCPLLNTSNTKFHIGKVARNADNNNLPAKRPIQFFHYHCVKHLENMEDDD